MTVSPPTGLDQPAFNTPASAPAFDGPAIASAAAALVAARRAAAGIDAFPGALPEDLDTAYAIQNAATAAWPDAVAGWKVALVPPALTERLGAIRFIGPVFANTTTSWTGAPLRFPVIAGGFGAVEAEFVVRVAADAPPDRLDYSPTEAAAFVGAVHAGIEVAGNALSSVMALGPMASVPSFGNNIGLVIGPQIAEGLGDLEAIRAETEIDGQSVGTGAADKLPGGIAAALAFALSVTARLGRPLTAGQWVSTGALTGVHAITIGQTARIAFTGIEPMTGTAVAAQPTTDA